MTFILIIHLIVSVFLICIVLLQTTKGSEIGSAFGGASQTIFGATGRTTVLSKITAAAAIIFMITCIFLARGSARKIDSSVITAPQPGVEQPILPAPAPEN